MEHTLNLHQIRAIERNVLAAAKTRGDDYLRVSALRQEQQAVCIISAYLIELPSAQLGPVTQAYTKIAEYSLR